MEVHRTLWVLRLEDALEVLEYFRERGGRVNRELLRLGRTLAPKAQKAKTDHEEHVLESEAMRGALASVGNEVTCVIAVVMRKWRHGQNISRVDLGVLV